MAAKGNGQTLVQLAEKYIGTPYQWGGTTPKTGFDCSGFVQWLYGKQGVNLPRTTFQQVHSGQPVSKSQLRPGDILFFEPTAQGPGHEGLYIGNGKFIESPHTGASVRISSLSGRTDYVTARRILAADAPPLSSAVASAVKQQTSSGDLPSAIPPPQPVPPPTALGTLQSDVQMPGSVNYTINPNFSPASLWGQVAQGDFVSPETQAMLQNAQLMGTPNAGY